MKGPKHLPHHPREAAEFILSVVGAANIPTLLTYTADIPWREINACIRALRIERGEAEFYNSDDGLAPAAGASSSAAA